MPFLFIGISLNSEEVGQLTAESDIEAMITEMKPWYDNYCFAKECLESDIRVFNCDMVLYYLRNYISYKHSPKVMLDPNSHSPMVPRCC